MYHFYIYNLTDYYVYISIASLCNLFISTITYIYINAKTIMRKGETYNVFNN